MPCANTRGRQNVLLQPLQQELHQRSTELQHCYALWRAVEMCGRTASPGRFEALCASPKCRAPGPGAHQDPRSMMVTLLQASHQGLTSDSAKLIGEGAVENQDVHREDPLTDGCGVLQDETLMNEKHATQNEGDHSSESESHSEMSHPVIESRHSHSVSEHTLQTHKQQPGWESHTGAHIVQRLGMVHLEVADHDQTHCVCAA